MKNILIVTSEYSSDTRPWGRWTKIVSFFAQQWAKDNNVIVIINSTKFPKIYYTSGFFLRHIVAQIYHKDPKLITERIWAKDIDFDDGNVKVYNRPLVKFYPHARLFGFQIKKQVNRIRTILSENNFIPDIIVGHWPYPQLDIILGLKEYYNTSKTAIVIHGSVSSQFPIDASEGKRLNLLDRVGCRNLPLAKDLHKRLSLNEEPFVCASGLPDEYTEKAPIDKEPMSNSTIKLISVCRLLDWKCLDAALKGIDAAFKGLDYKYEIIGDGPMTQSLNSLAKELNITDRVLLPGRIDRDEIQQKLRDSDIFVLISKHETFGLVYLEAMIQGCITIGSKNGGIDGIIVHGENGFLCNEGDAGDLARVLKQIAGLSSEERLRISKNAISTALEYTDSKVAKRYLENIS